MYRMGRDKEWYDRYCYLKFNEERGLQLVKILIKDRVYALDIIDNLSSEPYLSIYILHDNHDEEICRINIDDFIVTQIGELEIDPYILYLMKNMISLKPDQSLFYRSYVKDKSPEYDFEKSLWYNTILWLNNNHKDNLRDPNMEILF